MAFEPIDKRLVVNLRDDQEIARATKAYVEARDRSHCAFEARAEHLDDVEAYRSELTKLRSLSKEALQQYMLLQRLLNLKRHPLPFGQTSPVLTAVEKQLVPPFLLCPVVEHSTGLNFMGVRIFDDTNQPLIDEYSFGVGSTMPYIGTVRAKVDGGGPAWSWMDVAWGLIVPNDPTLCGLEVTGTIALTGGLIDSKSGSKVTIYLEAGITQFRTSKSLFAIDPSLDVPVSNVRALCSGENTTAILPNGYVDSTYGVHPVAQLHATVSEAYAYAPRPETIQVSPGDYLVVGLFCDIKVDAYSYVAFHLNDLGSLMFYSPSVVFHRIP